MNGLYFETIHHDEPNRYADQTTGGTANVHNTFMRRCGVFFY